MKKIDKKMSKGIQRQHKKTYGCSETDTNNAQSYRFMGRSNVIWISKDVFGGLKNSMVEGRPSERPLSD